MPPWEGRGHRALYYLVYCGSVLLASCPGAEGAARRGWGFTTLCRRGLRRPCAPHESYAGLGQNKSRPPSGAAQSVASNCLNSPKLSACCFRGQLACAAMRPSLRVTTTRRREGDTLIKSDDLPPFCFRKNKNVFVFENFLSCAGRYSLNFVLCFVREIRGAFEHHIEY